MKKYHVCATIAASDPSGGAGIQADIKTFSALGCYATSVITAITVQNTQKVYETVPLDGNLVYEQGSALFGDISPEALKIGACGSKEVVDAIVRLLKEHKPPFTVLDPVMVSSSGSKLLSDEGVETMKARLFPLCDLVTPNIPELARLSGKSGIANLEEAVECGRLVMANTKCGAILAKGGHWSGLPTDILISPYGETAFQGRRISTRNDHGTGCTLSSAIAAFTALGAELPTAVENAKSYLQKALENGADVQMGKGRGGMNHFFSPTPLIYKI